MDSFLIFILKRKMKMLKYIWDTDIGDLIREANREDIKKEQIVACVKQDGIIHIIYEEKE